MPQVSVRDADTARNQTVEIAERTLALDTAFALPRSAVSFETVFVVKDNRLHTRKVEVAGMQMQNGMALVRIEEPKSSRAEE
ncbi:MAG: hypothetical protein ACL93V_02320 [Candidatus Electrothrix sp. YB6]